MVVPLLGSSGVVETVDIVGIQGVIALLDIKETSKRRLNVKKESMGWLLCYTTRGTPGPSYTFCSIHRFLADVLHHDFASSVLTGIHPAICSKVIWYVRMRRRSSSCNGWPHLCNKGRRRGALASTCTNIILSYDLTLCTAIGGVRKAMSEQKSVSEICKEEWLLMKGNNAVSSRIFSC